MAGHDGNVNSNEGAPDCHLVGCSCDSRVVSLLPLRSHAVAGHDGNVNANEGSPRLQPPAHIRTLALH